MSEEEDLTKIYEKETTVNNLVNRFWEFLNEFEPFKKISTIDRINATGIFYDCLQEEWSEKICNEEDFTGYISKAIDKMLDVENNEI